MTIALKFTRPSSGAHHVTSRKKTQRMFTGLVGQKAAPPVRTQRTSKVCAPVGPPEVLAAPQTPQPTVSKPVGPPPEKLPQAQVSVPVTARPVGLPPEVLPQAQEPKPRAFTGLVGLPPDEPVQAVQAVQAVPQPTAPVHFKSAEEMLEDLKAERRKKRAEAAKAKRAANTAEKKRIKELLKKPWHEVVTDITAWLLTNKIPNMGEGSSMKGAPPRMGKLVYAGRSAQIELIDAYRDQIEDGWKRATIQGHSSDTDEDDADATSDKADRRGRSSVVVKLRLPNNEMVRALTQLSAENIEELSNVIWCSDQDIFLDAGHKCEASHHRIGLCHLCFSIVHDRAEHFENHWSLVKRRVREIEEQDRKAHVQGSAILAAHEAAKAKEMAKAVMG
jgi:hypothetical protein